MRSDARKALVRTAKAEALREAAREAKDHAVECPEGCRKTGCREANITTATWLYVRALRIEAGDE